MLSDDNDHSDRTVDGVINRTVDGVINRMPTSNSIITDLPHSSNRTNRPSVPITVIVIKQKGEMPPFGIMGGGRDAVSITSIDSMSIIYSGKYHLDVGYEIHRINGIPIDGFKGSQLKRLLKGCSRLELLVSMPTNEAFSWIYVNGQVARSPPASYISRIEHPCFENRWLTLMTAKSFTKIANKNCEIILIEERRHSVS
ncbi:hypothetical protein GJ496_008896 [Pomphorhynchus laevis]|nr:hypothetical protein GJ496_008896 [Pomphorhynchus laevis]